MAAILAAATPAPPVQAQRESAAPAVETIQIRPDVHVIFGGGGNVVVQIGAEGVILVDTGSAAMAEQVVAEIKKVTSRPIRLIINTSADADHIGGNERIAREGFNLNSNAFNAGSNAAAVLAHENVLNRVSAPTGEQAPFPVAVWPTETYISKIKSMYLNGEGIQVIHYPSAHSDGDSVVFFRRADVVVAGDILDLRRFPVIDAASGGSIQGEIDALNALLDLAIPAMPLIYKDDRTYVVPGHGRICRPCGSRRISRHGHGDPRSHQEHDREGPHHRTGESGQPDAGLPRAIRCRLRTMDDGHVRRGGVSKT